MKKKPLKEQIISIPDKVEAVLKDKLLTIKGPKGEVTKLFFNPKVKIEIKDKKITIKPLNSTKREKKIMGSFKAHIKNIISGCLEPHTYALKICSGHFPMTVAIAKDTLVVKNFFGEKEPRELKLKKGATVKVEGDIINIEGPDKELCGQIAADIEKLVKRTEYDRRIFQDGIYITKKDGIEIK